MIRPNRHRSFQLALATTPGATLHRWVASPSDATHQRNRVFPGGAAQANANAVALFAALIAASCATTTRSAARAEPTWRRAEAAPSVPAASAAEPLPVYVASFGLAPSVAADHFELASAQVGLGIGNCIADALYDTGRFRFLEEKAELAQRLADLIARRASGAETAEDPGGEAAAAPAGTPPEVHWLLYGEVVSVEVARRESVAGIVGRSEVETRVGV